MNETGKLRHIALFWLKNPESAQARAELAAGIETLRAIEQVRSLHIGMPAQTGERDVVENTFSLSETITFDSPADEAIYQVHPLHQAFIARCAPLWERVQVFDIADFE